MPQTLTVAVTVALAVANPGSSGGSGHSGRVFSWQQVEQQIAIHRQRVRQCGPLSAARALRLLGHEVDSSTWNEQFPHRSLRGVPLRDVVTVCQRLEPTTRARQISPSCIGQLGLPAILIVNDRAHCLVLEDWRRDTQLATVWDPSDGKRKSIPFQQLAASWKGDAIILRPRSQLDRVVFLGNLLLLNLVIVRLIRKGVRWRSLTSSRDVNPATDSQNHSSKTRS